MTRSHDVRGEIAAAAAAAKPAEAEQLDLMPPTRSNMTPAEMERVEQAVKRDRAGRPPGAQNKTTRETLDFIRKVIGCPMIESARQLMHTPETLSIELGCTKGEAFDRLEKIRTDLRPYFFAKQAPVDTDGKPVPGLTVEFHGQGAARIGADGAQLPPWLYQQDAPTADAPHEQNQRLIDVSPSVSHGVMSHDPKK
ncbi:hypothetical protein [Rhodopseudomonas sp. RCAM05734]|uniref:hypothetical protein n=1 Tax=Rhodopseudomonas sp. RCAM05734 TaxID=3457549 RepID=UPI0040440F1F